MLLFVISWCSRYVAHLPIRLPTLMSKQFIDIPVRLLHSTVWVFLMGLFRQQGLGEGFEEVC